MSGVPGAGHNNSSGVARLRERGNSTVKAQPEVASIRQSCVAYIEKARIS